MPLIVSPVTEADLPIIIAIDHAAMSSGPLPSIRQTLCGFTSQKAYLQNIEATLRTNFAKRLEQDIHYYKVTDSDLPPSSDPHNDIICFCVWTIHDTTRSPPSTTTHKTRTQPLRPSNFPTTPLSLFVSQQADALRASHFPHDSYLFFEMLMTAPAHQRRGAGKLLIQRALEMADARGILVSAG